MKLPLRELVTAAATSAATGLAAAAAGCPPIVLDNSSTTKAASGLFFSIRHQNPSGHATSPKESGRNRIPDSVTLSEKKITTP